MASAFKALVEMERKLMLPFSVESYLFEVLDTQSAEY